MLCYSVILKTAILFVSYYRLLLHAVKLQIIVLQHHTCDISIAVSYSRLLSQSATLKADL